MKWAIGIGAVIVVIVIVMIIGLNIGIGSKNGNGIGNGSGVSESISQSEANSLKTTSELQNTEETDSSLVIITLDGTDILYNGEKVDDAEALKNLIAENHSSDKTYQVNYKNAIKLTYDSVEQVLNELSDGSLAISVVYNADE